MKKKIITTLLTAVLVLLLVVVPSTVAAAGEYTIRLADANGNNVVSAKAGDTVTLVLSLENNPGIIGVGVSVDYPKGISLTKQPKDVSAFAQVATVVPVFSENITKNPYVMWWNLALGDFNKKLIVKEGKLAELTFKIARDLKPGDYKIKLTAPADMNRTSNVDSNKKIIDTSITAIKNISLISCTIRVQDPNCTHKWGDWTNVPGKVANCVNAGKQTRQCSSCLKNEERDVAALGHNYVEGVCTRCKAKPAPVKITQQLADCYVSEGSQATATVKATGEGLTYQWYSKDNGATNFSLSESYTTNTYSVTMNADRSGRQVYCKITDAFGNTATTKTVTLARKATITKQPVSVSVDKGAQAKVTVNATGDGLTYTWYFKNKGAASFSKTDSFISNTYFVAMNASRSGRQVYCKVTDKYGNTVTTKTVTLSMKPTITKQPVSVTVANGKTAKVTVKATGDGLTYQWYYKNKGASKFSLTTSFKGASYSVKMDASRSGRQVYCVITDKYGNTVKTKTVTLSMKATITKQPVSVAVANGKTAKVTVSAAGEGLTYKWYYKNKGASKFSLSSIKTNAYATTMKATVSGRQVYCKITDKYGNTVTTKTVTLSMKPTITKQPVSVTVANGKTAKVTVSATGEGLTYKWYYKNKGASKFSLTTSFKGASYSVKMDASRSGRQVYCVVTDKYGNTVTTKTVTLSIKAKITKQPASVAVANGKTAKVTVSAAGEGLTYKWYFKNKGATKFSLSSVKTSTYKTTMKSAISGRQLYCKVTDKFGNTVQTKTVTLKMK